MIKEKIEELKFKTSDKNKSFSYIDLNTNEFAFIQGSRNAIKLTDDLEYEFIRFDGIETHINQTTSSYTFKDIKNKIINKLNQKLEFAEERSKFVDELFEKNKWIYDLISTSKIIKKEVKNKSDFLAEQQELDSLFDTISNYISFPKFQNNKDKDEYETLVVRKKELNQQNHLTNSEAIELFKINSKIDLYNNRYHPKWIENEHNNSNEGEYLAKEHKIYNNDVLDLSKSKEISRLSPNRKKKMDITFWNKMGYSETIKSQRNEWINNLENAVYVMRKMLGYGLSNEERSNIQSKLLSKIKSKSFDVDGKKIFYSKDRQLLMLNKMYSELVGDLNYSLKVLTDEFSFKGGDKSTTEFNWHQNTSYIDNYGNEVYLSSNIINYANKEFYRSMLENYYELKESYKEKIGSEMWTILLDFEELLKRVEFDEIERDIIECIIDGMEVIETWGYIRKKYKTIRKDKYYRYLENYIPSKMRDQYIKEIDEWLYTYKIKGKYKKCSKCGEIKIISNDRYFSPKLDSKDGLHPYCKTCRS